MKKLLVALLSLALLLLAACGGEAAPTGGGEAAPTGGGDTGLPAQTTPGPAVTVPQTTAPAETQAPTGFLATRTGRFYSRFADGRMYMEYTTRLEGQTTTVVTATDGTRTYSETRLDGVSLGVSITEGKTLYTIDHSSKMVIKMALTTDVQSLAGVVLEESDVQMSELKTGSREIDGRTYTTEEWLVDGSGVVMCFDGDELVYMISSFDGIESVIRIITASSQVDDSLFEIPGDYTLIEM